MHDLSHGNTQTNFKFAVAAPMRISERNSAATRGYGSSISGFNTSEQSGARRPIAKGIGAEAA